MAKNSAVPVAHPVLRGRNLALAALVFCGTVLIYLPSFAGNFIWNDSDYVTAPALRSLAGLGAIWFRPGATEQYYPLLHSAFWLQHRLWGDHPFGYHLVTVLLHATAAVLFGLILRRLAVPGAWLAAALFAFHPAHVESVAWITEQKNTLSLVCYLLAAAAYLRFDETHERRSYFAGFAWFVVSLLCRPVTATLPAALLVVMWWKHGRLGWRRDFRPLLPWLAVGAAAGVFSSWVEKHYLGAHGADFDLPFLERGLVAGRAVWFYLGKLVWPAGLNFVYPRWVPDPTVWWQWLFPVGLLGLAALLWRIRHRPRAPLAAFLLFTGSLFPVLGFVNLYGALYSFVWDHWQYLPDLGPLALGGAGLAWCWQEVVPRRWQPFGPAAGAALAASLALLSWEHIPTFHDNDRLYRTTIARNPDAWMAHFNLGGMLLKDPAHLAEAIHEFETVLHINPNAADAHYNLGTTLSRIPGRLPEAIIHFQAALRLDPGNAAIHYNYGNTLANLPGHLPDAIAQYREAVRLNPQLAEAQYNLGLALLRLNRPELLPEAIEHFESCLRGGGDFPLAREIVQRWQAANR